MYSFIRKRHNTVTWETLLLAADSDFLSHILLDNAGIKESTALWMAEQAVEKYIKALLLKKDSNYSCREIGHNLQKGWECLKEEFPEYEFYTSNSTFTKFIFELTMFNENDKPNNIHLRYSPWFDIWDPIFFKTFFYLCNNLRILLLGKPEFEKRGFLGMCDMSFGSQDAFFKKPIIDSKKILQHIIKKYNLLETPHFPHFI